MGRDPQIGQGPVRTNNDSARRPWRDRWNAGADRFRALLRERPLSVALLATTAVVATVLTCFTPHFETNDDPAMNLIAAGLAFTSHPDEHLVFTSVLIGLPLKWLYEVCPRVPWYGLYQLLAIAAASVATVYSLLRVSPTVRQSLVAWLVLVTIILPCSAEMQFTKTAFLASFSGLLLLLAPLCGVSRWSIRADVAGALLVLLGALIRAESFALAAVMALPIALAGAWQARRGAVRRAMPLALAIGSGVAAIAFNSSYYRRDPAWKDFYAYNALRARFTDYGYYKSSAAAAVFEAVGWQKNDVAMLRKWCFVDPERYSLAKLQEVVAKAPMDSPAPLSGTLLAVARQVLADGPLYRLCLAVFAATILTAGRPWWLLPGLLFGLAYGLGAVLGTWYWFTPRVTFCLLAGILAGSAMRPNALGPIGASSPRRSEKLLQFAFAIFALALLPWTLFAVSGMDVYRLKQHEIAERVTGELDPQPDQLFVTWEDQFFFQHLVFPFEYPGTLGNFRCVALSWLEPAPYTVERLREFHITDLYQALWERPDVYLVAAENYCELYEKYVKEHYQTSVKCHVTFDRTMCRIFQVSAGVK